GQYVVEVAAGARGGDRAVVVGQVKTGRRGRAGEKAAVRIDHRADPLPSGGRVFHDPGHDTAGHGEVAGHVGVAGAVGDCPDRHAGPDGDVRPAQVAVG